MASDFILDRREAVPALICRHEDFVIVKPATHLNLKFGYGDDAGVRLRRCGRAEIDPPVRLDDTLIIPARPVLGGSAVQRLAHVFRFGEVVAGPRVTVPGTGMHGHCRKQQYDARCSQSQSTLASG